VSGPPRARRRVRILPVGLLVLSVACILAGFVAWEVGLLDRAVVVALALCGLAVGFLGLALDERP
jgi:hypothetical protein